MNYTDINLSEDMTLAEWTTYWLETYIRPVAKASTYGDLYEVHDLSSDGRHRRERRCDEREQKSGGL